MAYRVPLFCATTARIAARTEEVISLRLLATKPLSEGGKDGPDEIKTLRLNTWNVNIVGLSWYVVFYGCEKNAERVGVTDRFRQDLSINDALTEILYARSAFFVSFSDHKDSPVCMANRAVLSVMNT